MLLFIRRRLKRTGEIMEHILSKQEISGKFIMMESQPLITIRSRSSEVRSLACSDQTVRAKAPCLTSWLWTLNAQMAILKLWIWASTVLILWAKVISWVFAHSLTPSGNLLRLISASIILGRSKDCLIRRLSSKGSSSRTLLTLDHMLTQSQTI